MRAVLGDPAAQFELATMYDLGERAAQDSRLAFEWYRLAADAGLSDAAFNVAVMLDSGRGTQQSSSEAATWYGRAAALGNHRAQYNLALLYDAGDGVPHNSALAAAWFRKAAPGVSVAASRLATLRPDQPTGQISPAVLSFPLGAIAGGAAPLEFVWTASVQPAPARYLIEVRTLGTAGSREVFSMMTEGSAVAAPLRTEAGTYGWRVFTIDQAAAHYVASDWAKFTIQMENADR